MFKQRPEAYKNMILAKLGLLPKIGARECEVSLSNYQEIKSFMENFHIRGVAKGFLFAKLEYKGKIVGAISLGRHHRNKDIVVLNRLCFGDISVMGGFSRLLSFAKIHLKEMGVSSITTWSENTVSQGKSYKKLGFTLDSEIKPDYSYYKSGKLKSKQSMTKKSLSKMGGIGATESEMAQSLGYERIWGCGKKRWILDI